jgi:hypothetical protein
MTERLITFHHSSNWQHPGLMPTVQELIFDVLLLLWGFSIYHIRYGVKKHNIKAQQGKHNTTSREKLNS